MRRAFQAGEQHKQRPECSMLDEKKCELCHCYFLNLSPWPATADGNFQGRGHLPFM